MNDSNFLILSCDGGGIRGLITAMIIQELDKQIPFLNQIDLFAGTSTGGIIALPEFLTKSAIAKHRSLTGSGFEQSDRRFPPPTVCCQILS